MRSEVRIAATKSIATVAMNNQLVQELLLDAGAFEALVDAITDELTPTPLVHWSIYAIYCMVLGNASVAKMILNRPKLRATMLNCSYNEWPGFRFNYALKCCEYVRMKHRFWATSSDESSCSSGSADSWDSSSDE